MPLQHLDLVSIRILNEEKPRQQTAIAFELDDLAGFEAGFREAGMLCIEIVRAERDMAVAICPDRKPRSGLY